MAEALLNNGMLGIASSRCGVELSSLRRVRVKFSNVSAILVDDREHAKAPESDGACADRDCSREPKRPPSAQFLFIADMRSKHGQALSASVVLQMWQDLCTADKEQYEAFSAKLKEQYDDDLRRWRRRRS